MGARTDGGFGTLLGSCALLLLTKPEFLRALNYVCL